MKHAKLALATAFVLVINQLSVVALADSKLGQSDFSLKKVIGQKYPNPGFENGKPRKDMALTLGQGSAVTGFTELLQYVMASPDQEEAGSCLYMSLTGLAEWWLAKLNPSIDRSLGGPLDLSERYLMNVASQKQLQRGIRNWRTDSIFVLNNIGRAALNSSFPFTKGWTYDDAGDGYIAAPPGATGAEYGTKFNWIDETQKVRGGVVALPRFNREVLFEDPDSNQWNIGVMPPDIVDRVQAAMQKRKAPVQILYNHMGYWHAALIVGYDDDRSSEGCPFIQEFRDYLRDEEGTISRNIKHAKTSEERQQLQQKLNSILENSEKLQRAFYSGGGCAPKGMFYVRDSIYEDPSMPVYDYGTGVKSDGRHYGPRFVLREYAWLKYLANHAVQVYIQ